MIAEWMLYATAISALLGLAALSGEVALVRWRLPSRPVWGMALVGTVALPATTYLLGLVPRPDSASATADVGEITVVAGIAPAIAAAAPRIALPAAVRALDPLLLAGWAIASLVVLGFLLVSHATFRRRRGEWRRVTLEGVPVLQSRGVGPAVFGFLPGEIILPAWVEDLPSAQRELLLRHEAEHIRARDPLLLLLGLATVAALPWNAAAWWLLRRLRAAIEVDCDRRVVRGSESIGTYGALLLEVARRANPVPLAAAAFGAHTRQLERRVRIMTSRGDRYRMAAAIVATLFAGLSLLAACQMEKPTAPSPRTDAPTPVLAAGVDLSTEPVFTPMQVRPRLLNRQEFAQAMEQRYPQSLREAGVGGTVTMWVFLDESGVVRNTRVVEGTGHEELDAVATGIMREIARFSPAKNREVNVSVWVQLPITFQPFGAATAAAASAPAPAPGASPAPAPIPSPSVEQLRSRAVAEAAARGEATPEAIVARRREQVSAAATNGPSGALAPGASIEDDPVFTPMDRRPQLSNRQEFGVLIERLYPAELKERGIGGTVTMWVFIDEEGAVGNTRVTQSSGHAAMDHAALEAMRDARFTPAMNRDQPVPVWVQLPVTFQVPRQPPADSR